MNRSVTLPFLLIAALLCFVEIGVYFYSTSVSPAVALIYQLAARYSARISFLLFVAFMLPVVVFGLQRIFQTPTLRRSFYWLLFAFVFNHILHFGYVIANFLINPFELGLVRHGGGLVLFLVLAVSPFLLFKTKELSVRIYRFIHLGIFGALIVFLISYLGRIATDTLEFASERIWYQLFLGVTIGLFFGNVYRIVQESRA